MRCDINWTCCCVHSPHDGPIRAIVRSVIVAFTTSHKYAKQGLNYIAALLLIVTDSPEDAFWLMDVSLASGRVADYYKPDMAGVQTDLRVLEALLM